MPAIASSTVAYSRSHSSVTYCGGASSISPAARAASASSGRNQRTASDSTPSATASAISACAGATKNHVANRFGEIAGRRPVGEVHERVDVDLDARLFGRLAHRGAGGRAGQIVAVVPVAVVDPTAGEDPGPAVERQLRRPLREQRLEALRAVAQHRDGRGRLRVGAAGRGARRPCLLSPVFQRRGHPSRGGPATPSCRTCPRSSSEPRR